MSEIGSNLSAVEQELEDLYGLERYGDALLGPSVCQRCKRYYPVPTDDPMLALCGRPGEKGTQLIIIILRFRSFYQCPLNKWGRWDKTEIPKWPPVAVETVEPGA